MKPILDSKDVLDFTQIHFYKAVEDYAKACPRNKLLRKCRNKLARYLVECIESSRQAIVCFDQLSTYRRIGWLLNRLVRDTAAVITKYGFDFIIVTGDIYAPGDNGSLMNINLCRNKMQIIFFMPQTDSRFVPNNGSRPCLINAS